MTTPSRLGRDRRRAIPSSAARPSILDIVGVNYYCFGQMEYREQGPHASLEPGDGASGRSCDLLEEGWERYRRP